MVLNIEPICDIVILNFNGKDFLARCLYSIEKMEYPNYNVIVVDNASSDGSADFVRLHFPCAKLVINHENLGFGGGMNSALDHVKSDYVLFLNNDTEVDPLCLRRMVQMAESDTSIGIVTCKLLDLDARNVIDAVGGFIIDIYGFPYAIGHGEIDRHQYDHVRNVFAFGILLIRTPLLKRIGGFDDAYFTYVEDIDLCWRAQLAGYAIRANPSAVIYHKSGGGTIPKGKKTTNINFRRRVRYLTERNTFRTLLKNYSSPTLVRILPRYLGLLFSEIIMFLVLKRLELALSDIKAILWNIRNFKEVYRLRTQVQSIRVVDDIDIQKRMIRTSLKIAFFEKELTFFSSQMHGGQ
jgi:GT2 family glycosyltransferase